MTSQDDVNRFIRSRGARPPDPPQAAETGDQAPRRRSVDAGAGLQAEPPTADGHAALNALITSAIQHGTL